VAMRRSAAVLAALLGLALWAAPAAAAEPQSHPLIESFTPPGPGLGLPEPLKGACGVAVDSGGFVFVSNYYEHAIYIFNAQHQYVTQVKIEEEPTAPNGRSFDGPCDLALDPAGDLYVNNWHASVVKLPRTGPTSFGPRVTVDPGPAAGVAVDPANGTVLVDHRTYVAEYEPSGAPVMNGLEPLKIGLGSLEDGFGLAVSSFKGDGSFASTEGLVYVADAGGGGSVRVYKPNGDPVQTIAGDGTTQLGFSDLLDAEVAVDPHDGHIYVTDNLGPGLEQPQLAVDEFSPAGRYRETVPSGVEAGRGSNLLDAEPSGLAFFGGNLYVSNGNYFFDEDPQHKSNGQVSIFGPSSGAEFHVLTVAKTGSGSGAVTSSPFGVGCGAACVGEFKGQATLTPRPAIHSRFVGWTGCDVLLAESRCQMGLSEAEEVTAEFELIPQLPLSLTVGGSGSGSVVSLPAGIECAHTCEAGFDEGGEVTLVAVPNPGSEFAGWSGCEAEPAGSCLVTMAAAPAVSAQFVPIPAPPPLPPRVPGQHTLSVLVTGTGSATGTIVSEPGGISCGSSCARAFTEGAAVTLVAQPAAHSAFLGWGGCDSVAGPRCTVALGSDRTVVAAFGPGSPGPLKVGRASGKEATTTLLVKVPAAGELSASGKGIRPAGALPLAAGKVTLKLRLDGVGERALRGAGAAGLRRKVALTFTPLDGGTTVHAIKMVTFKRGKGR